MSSILKIGGIILAAILGLGIIAFIVLFNQAFVPLKTKVMEVPSQKYNNWDEVFANPQDVSVTEFNTGTFKADMRAMLEDDSPNSELVPEGKSDMTMSAYWLRHNRKGDILIDTGLNDSFDEKTPTGDYPLFMSMWAKSMGFDLEQKEGQDIGSLLALNHIDPQMVFLTHLHPDHITGLKILNDDVTCVFGKDETTFITMATAGGYFAGKKDLQTLDWSKSKKMGPFDAVLDVLGDASLWAISTPGHSEDHVSYLVNTLDGPVLILGDAVSFSTELEYDLDTKKMGGEKAAIQTKKSLHQIRNFLKAYPDTKVMLSHDFIKDEDEESVKLYVLDGGRITVPDISKFDPSMEKGISEISANPCYLIVHPEGTVLWDTGFQDSLADSEEEMSIMGGTLTFSLSKKIEHQLAEIGIDPSEIDYLGFTNLHGVYTGNISLFPQAKVLIQEREYESAFSQDAERLGYDPQSYTQLKNMSIQKLDGDFDLFGDGLVKIIYTPATTPGHQVVYIDLPGYGPIVTAGDLYTSRRRREKRLILPHVPDREAMEKSFTRIDNLMEDTGAVLWLNHDKTHYEDLRKVPEYYN